MGKNNVIVNGRSVVTKKSRGKSIAFPDVCKTLTPGGPVPVPYPNIAQSSDLKNGSKKVKAEGASICLQGSEFSKSTGDEAGAAGGIASGQTQGRAVPLNYSFNVKIEGRCVVRNLDLFINNNGNTPPTPVVQNQVLASAPAMVAENEHRITKAEIEKCPYCGREKPDCNFQNRNKGGKHKGKGRLLSARIFKGKIKEDHPWYSGPYSLQAHHLICSEAMDNLDWTIFCKQSGYNINHKRNGVMLPATMDAACQIYVAVHRGGHAKGRADDINLPYPDAIKKEIRVVKEKIETGNFCSEPSGIIKNLNEMGGEILGHLDDFTWTITADGKDYMTGGRGCGDQTSISNRKKESCSSNRDHKIIQFKTKQRIPVKSEPLRIGA